jgi:hypothetical protein
MPILAKRAMEIAAGKSHGKNHSAGPEMKQGLFFDRVNSQGRYIAVKRQYPLAVFVSPYLTGAKKTVLHGTTART